MSLPKALAEYLEVQGYGIYRANNEVPFTENDIAIFFAYMPTFPSQVIVITPYSGPESDTKLEWDLPRIQIRVRGGEDPEVPYILCQTIYRHLHGLGPITMSGIRIQSIEGTSSGAAYMGMDSNGRHEFVTNFEVTERRD